MATFVLEDLAAAIEVMVFPKTMLQYGELLDADAIVRVKGRVDGREDTPKLMAMEITRPEIAPRRRAAGAAAGEGRARSPTTRSPRLKEHPRRAPGRQPGVRAPRSAPTRRPCSASATSSAATPRNGLFAELRILFGADCIA